MIATRRLCVSYPSSAIVFTTIRPLCYNNNNNWTNSSSNNKYTHQNISNLDQKTSPTTLVIPTRVVPAKVTTASHFAKRYKEEQAGERLLKKEERNLQMLQIVLLGVVVCNLMLGCNRSDPDDDANESKTE